MRKPGLANNSFDFGPQVNPDPDLMLRTLRSATPIGPEELGTRAVGEVVKVWVQALPGPGGVLTAPLSGDRCVWFRSVFAPVQQGADPSRFLPDLSTSDCRPALGSGLGMIRQTVNASEGISTAPFVVGEVGGAQLLVDPLVADVCLDRPTHNRWWRGRMRISMAAEIEWSLPPGAPVLVVGRIGADGHLISDQDAGLVITPLREEDVVTRFTRDSGNQQMNRFLIGSTRFNRRLARWTRYLVSAVALVVLAAVLVVLLH